MLEHFLSSHALVKPDYCSSGKIYPFWQHFIVVSLLSKQFPFLAGILGILHSALGSIGGI